MNITENLGKHTNIVGLPQLEVPKLHDLVYTAACLTNLKHDKWR